MPTMSTVKILFAPQRFRRFAFSLVVIGTTDILVDALWSPLTVRMPATCVQSTFASVDASEAGQGPPLMWRIGT